MYGLSPYLNIVVEAEEFAVFESVFVLFHFRRFQNRRQGVTEVHCTDFASLGSFYLGLVPRAVVAHTAAYHKVLLFKIYVLPSQSADLTDAKYCVVCDLYGEQCGAILRFQKILKLQVHFVSERRYGSNLSVILQEQLVIILFSTPYYVLHRVKGNHTLGEYCEAKRSLQNGGEQTK